MIVEFHLLQNFAPSNLNRDDTGSPKDCLFGGIRRARISSQCQKHAIRKYFAQAHLFGREQLATRTKRILPQLVQRLVEQGRDPDAAKRVTTALLGSVNISVDDAEKTQYLLYLGADEIAHLAGLCQQHWDELDRYASAVALFRDMQQAVEQAAGEDKPDEKKDKKKSGKKDKVKDDAPTLSDQVKRDVLAAIGSSKSVDLALFGRMLAHLPEKNVDAACQIAHSVSVNEVTMETDFYTAIDDLKPDDTQGADMMGVIEFNSSCFYRYAKIDLRALTAALGAQIARDATVAFAQALVAAIPSGKQNSMAAHNLPQYIRVLVRQTGQPWNLVNAFVRPIRPSRSGEGDLIRLAITALETHCDQLKKMYAGTEGGLHQTTDLVANLFDPEPLSFSTLLDQLGKALQESAV